MDNKFIDVTSGDFFPVLEALDQGILMADKDGSILYYNKTHAKMDGLENKDVIGRKLVEIYDLDENESTIMRCLRDNKAIINTNHIYTARNGRVVNSINSNFPIRKNGKLIGAICFVKDYEYLDGIISKIEGTYRKIPIQNETCFTFKSIIGQTALIREVLNKAKLASNSPSSVMLYGETGTGKELFAQSIHTYSYRKSAPYMAVNCAALPETLLEGILFGSTKGSYTGAMEKPGLFEQANGGTIFLDEINSMPVALQAKLLRVLQEKKVRRIGASKEIVLDLKIISSINELPQESISNGNLRKDLFYRLGVIFLAIPPLRERINDIEILTDFFIKKHNKILGKNVKRVSVELKNYFQKYHWPGNVRELENLVEGAMNMVGSGWLIKGRHIASDAVFLENKTTIHEKKESAVLNSGTALRWNKKDHEAFLKENRSVRMPDRQKRHGQDNEEKKKILQALIHHSCNVKKASGMLNIARQTLHRKIKKYSIDRKKILENIEKKKIEKTLLDSNGNIALAAQSLSITRQLLNYKMKKYTILKSTFQKMK